MIHAASRGALVELRRRLDAVTSGVPAEDLTTLAGELHSISLLLSGQPQLRRALGDGSTQPDSRSDLISGLLGLQVSARSKEVARAAVALRWSSPWDLTDAIDIAADSSLLVAAERRGQLDAVEDELFRLERILSDQGDLTALLDDASATVDRRSGLLGTLIAGKVNPVTKELLENAISSTRKRSILLAIDDLLEEVALRQNRSIAKVTSAVALTAEQQTALTTALSTTYGRAISLRVAVDPAIKGGLIVRVGDEIIDGSVAHRLVAARAALAG